MQPRSINAITAEHVVEITWQDGRVSRYPNRLLRVTCNCAACVDEFTGEQILDPSTVPNDIAITDMAAVGNYAVRITYSDGHDTGITTWKHLRELDEGEGPDM